VIVLKNQLTTEDIRLDRIAQFDERSRRFPVKTTLEKKEWRSYTWRCEQWFDQGREGACVAYALAHECAARPAETRGMHDKWLKEDVYWEAQKIDPWPGGSYPGASPFYEGTSVLAGVKILHKKNFFREYRWAFGIEDLILGVGYNGPAVIGVNWYHDMYFPDENGMISKSGSLLGGHAVLVRGVDLNNETVTIRNSWGQNWGDNGDCYMKIHELESLLHENGEAVFFMDRETVPMVPYSFGL